MPKKKRSALASLSKKVASRKRKRKNPESTSAGPSVVAELGETLIPGIAAYGLVRVAGRLAYKLGRRKSPKLAAHLGAITPALVGAGVWFAGSRVESLERFHGPITIGAGIAAVQALAQTYLPGQTWFVFNDYHLNDVLPQASSETESPEGAGAVSTMGHPTRGRPSNQFEANSVPELSSFEGWGAATDDASLDALEDQALGIH